MTVNLAELLSYSERDRLLLLHCISNWFSRPQDITSTITYWAHCSRMCMSVSTLTLTTGHVHLLVYTQPRGTTHSPHTNAAVTWILLIASRWSSANQPCMRWKCMKRNAHNAFFCVRGINIFYWCSTPSQPCIRICSILDPSFPRPNFASSSPLYRLCLLLLPVLSRPALYRI